MKAILVFLISSLSSGVAYALDCSIPVGATEIRMYTAAEMVPENKIESFAELTDTLLNRPTVRGPSQLAPPTCAIGNLDDAEREPLWGAVDEAWKTSVEDRVKKYPEMEHLDPEKKKIGVVLFVSTGVDPASSPPRIFMDFIKYANQQMDLGVWPVNSFEVRAYLIDGELYFYEEMPIIAFAKDRIYQVSFFYWDDSCFTKDLMYSESRAVALYSSGERVKDSYYTVSIGDFDDSWDTCKLVLKDISRKLEP
jgi:hypothetical protein